MEIANGKVVLFHYTLTDDGGAVIDSSSGQDPLGIIHGHGHIIEGLEEALLGKSKGDKFNVSIAPEKAYGPRNEQMVQSVPKTDFQDPDQLQPGMQFQVQTEAGPILLTISEVKDTEVMVDGNHPMAGKTLHFDVEVTDVREPTQEELDHGHVHGEGGVQH